MGEGDAESPLGRPQIGSKTTPKLSPVQRQQLDVLEQLIGLPKDQIMTEALRQMEEAYLKTQPQPVAKAAQAYDRVANTLDDMGARSRGRGDSNPDDELDRLMTQQIKRKMQAQMLRDMDGGNPKDNSDARMMTMRAEQMLRADAARQDNQQMMSQVMMMRMLGGNDGGGSSGNKDMVDMIKASIDESRRAQEESRREFQEYIKEQARREEKKMEMEERREEKDEFQRKLAELEYKNEEAQKAIIQGKEDEKMQNASAIEELKQMTAQAYADMKAKYEAALNGPANAGKEGAAATELSKSIDQLALLDGLVVKRALALGMQPAEAENLIIQEKAAAGISWTEAAEKMAKTALPLMKEMNRSIELVMYGNKAPGAQGADAPPPPPDDPGAAPDPNFVNLALLPQAERDKVIARFPAETQADFRASKPGEHVSICTRTHPPHLLPLPCRLCATQAAGGATPAPPGEVAPAPQELGGAEPSQRTPQAPEAEAPVVAPAPMELGGATQRTAQAQQEAPRPPSPQAPIAVADAPFQCLECGRDLQPGEDCQCVKSPGGAVIPEDHFTPEEAAKADEAPVDHENVEPQGAPVPDNPDEMGESPQGAAEGAAADEDPERFARAAKAHAAEVAARKKPAPPAPKKKGGRR